MGLYEVQRRMLQEALLDAFPTEELLDDLLTQQLGVQLSAIAVGTTQRRRVFQVIDWAAANERLANLLAAARAVAPTHGGLAKAMVPGDAPPESWRGEPEPEFAVLITGYAADQRFAVLKAVREFIPGTLAESVAFLDAALADPHGHPIATGLWPHQVVPIKRRLEAAGAEVAVVPA